jgi:hypothetical protein
LDEVELDAGRKLWRMLAPLDMGGAEHDHTKWAQIQAELLAHAQDTCICSPAWISTRRYASNGSWHALGCPKDSE